MTEYVDWTDTRAEIDRACKLPQTLYCRETGRVFGIINWQSSIRTGEAVRIQCDMFVEREPDANPAP